MEVAFSNIQRDSRPEWGGGLDSFNICDRAAEDEQVVNIAFDLAFLVPDS